MTELERFKTVVSFERPDYWPMPDIKGLGMIHNGGLVKLHNEGLPESVNDLPSWLEYWGRTGFEGMDGIGRDAPDFEWESWTEGEFEFLRSESGALRRQVLNNAATYSMPEFIEFDVRDRASWETYRERMTPTRKADIEEDAERLDNRTRPLFIGGGSTWGRVRNQMGPERALFAVHDDPDLVREMIEWQTWIFDEFNVPMIERYRPEAIMVWEDFCFNHGMLISPATFRDLCAPHYRRLAEVGRDCGVELLIVDCDGKVDEFCLLLEEVGFNGCWPMEQVCGNDLLAYRERQPKFIFAGGIEKGICNTGNEARIEPELFPKVSVMLETGGYFPMFDHALQTDASFDSLCCVMTLLHEILGSPEDLGEFPRKH